MSSAARIARFLVFPLLSALLCATACGDPAPEPPAGGGTISGSPGGHPFDTVAASYVIGSPDDAARTVVIYVLDAGVGCDVLQSPGWDEQIPDGAQAIEVKLIGKTPGSYPVSADATPAAGEADVNYTELSSSGPSEIRAIGGTVTLDSLEDGGVATGSFDLQFPGGPATGTFSAAFCSGGHEP